jgi:hypothetical protein
MWMRACAICKTVLFKFHLAEKVRCRCGWEWVASDQQCEGLPIQPLNCQIPVDQTPSRRT